jgi:hypothetical protein
VTGLYNGATLISSHVNIIPIQSQQRNVQQLLDGKYYIQDVGEPAKSHQLSIKTDLEGLTNINTAEKDGALMSCYNTNYPSFSGYIMSKGNPAREGNKFIIELTLSEEAII